MNPRRPVAFLGIRYLVTSCALALLAECPARASAPAEAAWQGGVDASLAGGRADDGGATAALSASGWRQVPTGWHDTFWLLGGEYDRYEFSAGAPGRLQALAALLGIEYRRDGETAARLTLRPGLYFSQRARRDSWDIPVDFVSGVPLAGRINGVVGFSSARFYRHPLPIFGVVYDFAPRWRLQLVYPEAALEYTASTAWQWRLGGELLGGGFLDDRSPGAPTPIEYSSYRVGLRATHAWAQGGKLAVGVGFEVLRRFDAFRSGHPSADRHSAHPSLEASWTF